MAYELDVCTSSLGAFTSLWGFHRVGLLEYRQSQPNILHISKNLAADTTADHL